jgi:hypothetical protein
VLRWLNLGERASAVDFGIWCSIAGGQWHFVRWFARCDWTRQASSAKAQRSALTAVVYKLEEVFPRPRILRSLGILGSFEVALSGAHC